MDDNATPVIPPGPKPPAIPVRPEVPQKVTLNPVNEEPILIRTMKDDLQEAKSGRKVVPEPLPVLRAPAVSRPNTENTAGESGKSVIIPQVEAKKKTNHAVLISTIAILVIVLIASGIGFWFYNHQTLAPSPAPIQTPQSVSAIIPNNATSIVEYRISDKKYADNINQFWASQGINQATIDSALQGDPRFLMNNQSVQDIYYVALPNETAPYLIFAHNDATAPVVSSIDKANILDQSDWYVIHASPVAAYQQALANGTFANTDILTVNSDTPYAMYMYANQGASAQIMNGLNDKKFTPNIKNLTIWSDLSPKDGQIGFHGILASSPSSTQDKIDTTLVSSIPSQATYVWVGSNLASDIQPMSNNPNLLDQALLSQPNISQFVAQLNNAYAYYQTAQPSGGQDIGLVINLPASNPALVVGDKGIESALPAILPLTVGQKQGVPLAFNDAVYNGVNLRYVNIPGTTQALDYAIISNHLLVATSKNAMFDLIDSAQGKKVNILQSGSITNVTQNMASNSQSISGLSEQLTSSIALLPGFNFSAGTSLSLNLQPLDPNTLSIAGVIYQTPAPPTQSPTPAPQP